MFSMKPATASTASEARRSRTPTAAATSSTAAASTCSGGDWTPRHLTVVEFEDADNLRAMFESEELAEIRKMVAGAIEGTLIAVDGV